jgi:hypothetical protein
MDPAGRVLKKDLGLAMYEVAVQTRYRMSWPLRSSSITRANVAVPPEASAVTSIPPWHA